ncbi:MAG TPA: hypothetical protein DCW88_06475 [Agrobacterium sp.]|uniref:calcium-binding protein n=1 Tax=Agrobacterium pusense TaxID=648995 RepID=UPI000E9336F3|nr:cadherin-like domain-containing protein [Agrobacterium pusense]MDH0871350.1 cadherin-like domain-containing protein [Agrobacterium pusense]HAU75176.1 hypothetical protein [Agrobacterium sp.]
MSIEIKDGQDDLSALNREAPGVHIAPGRRFESPERTDRTLLSHALFSTLGLGIAAYLGRVHDVYAPSPTEEADDTIEAGYPIWDAESTVVASDPMLLAQQLASFWTQFLESYLEETEGVRRYVRYNVLSINFDLVSYDSDFMPFRVAIPDVDNNLFRFPPLDTPDSSFGVRLALPEAESGEAKGGNGSGGNVPGNDGGGNGSNGGNDPVNVSNRAPVAVGPLYLGIGLVNLSILLTWADLARAAVDPDGDRLLISNIQSSSGSVRAYGVDGWIFTPLRDMNGIVSFTYTLSDGQGSVTGRAWLDLRPHPPKEVIGTAWEDTLLGTPKDDIIKALGGDDIVYGREGNDLIDGDDGNDVLLGGDGNDVIYGGKGNDRIFGGRGGDVLFGDDGDDIIFGEEGSDIVYGGNGNDFISGGDGNDRLFGDAGDDLISGDAGDDIIDGGAGNDRLIGGAGDDVVLGGEGDDGFIAGVLAALDQELEGDVLSILMKPLPDGDDIFDGGSGNDTYDASATRVGVHIDLAAGTAEGVEIGTDTLISVENAIGGSGNDRIVASNSVNVLIGGQGNDIFVFATASSLHNDGNGRDEIRDFEIGDKIDFSRLSKDLGVLYFGFGDEASSDLDRKDHKALIKLYKELTDDGEDRQVVQIYSDLDGDEKYELVVISQKDLSSDDFILTATVTTVDNGSIAV